MGHKEGMLVGSEGMEVVTRWERQQCAEGNI